MTIQKDDLQLDVTAEGARALHRVVRAMHDGHCPRCGHLAPSELFYRKDRHECPACSFTVTEVEAREALKEFQPYFMKSVEVFERWKAGEKI